jgi:putative transposase
MPALTIPKSWPRSVQAAIVQVIALAQYALAYTRSWAANSSNERIRLAAKAGQLEQEVALLREEIRIKDARVASIPAARRPHYGPTDRLAILALRAARGWSIAQTARVFQVTEATISTWGKRLDEGGPNPLLLTPAPVNKYPEFVRAIVQRLQGLCGGMGKMKIAQVLARAGLHLAASTVGRILKEPPVGEPNPPPVKPMPSARRVVTARHPNHVWHVDLTVVPTRAGMWTSWLPFALPQCWPFCWWVAVAVDHYSRKALGFAVFKKQPTSEQVRAFLSRLIAQLGTAPKYLVTDSGTQFTAVGFGAWCRGHGIRHRKGAVGQTGSIAVCERFIRTLKGGCTRALAVVPLVQRTLRRELSFFFDWFNRDRPHMTLGGATPDEIYSNRRPACRAPRFEPRPNWPRGSPCAKPQTLVKGQPGVVLELKVEFAGGRGHLPRVTHLRAA